MNWRNNRTTCHKRKLRWGYPPFLRTPVTPMSKISRILRRITSNGSEDSASLMSDAETLDEAHWHTSHLEHFDPHPPMKPPQETMVFSPGDLDISLGPLKFRRCFSKKDGMNPVDDLHCNVMVISKPTNWGIHQQKWGRDYELVQ